MKRHIRLRGINGDVEGLVWEAEALVRTGRLASLEVVLDDVSVRLLRKVPGPKLVRVGKRLVARPTVRDRDLPVVDIAALLEEERNRWPW